MKSKKKKKVFIQISSDFSPKSEYWPGKKRTEHTLFVIKAYAQLPRGGASMPQFCLLFYAILQSWQPKGGGPWHNAPPLHTPLLRPAASKTNVLPLDQLVVKLLLLVIETLLLLTSLKLSHIRLGKNKLRFFIKLWFPLCCLSTLANR